MRNINFLKTILLIAVFLLIGNIYYLIKYYEDIGLGVWMGIVSGILLIVGCGYEIVIQTKAK
ncbi:MAG: hypothetical protein ACSHWW_02825 [Nonlabens sp.]|uniref:hypothetical protein n=1 Tax=Nonlabens sp. TaxID=1888209 RepID=UPI003EF1624F